ncbi:MAG: hypothetical protein A3E25_01165 [Burkholderiales bacterium RIFCSPHIGHO2_12_FULL_69_20]|nr:MAG: hypothetical protein A3E25_01165 [Burkholderiales bacterium RIFCSPHIGHO2_12_FULL_69_20]
MNAPALAMPTPLPAAGLQSLAAPTQVAPVAGLALLAATCVEQTAELLRLACRRGQLEDASAAARTALPLAVPHSPHQALLRALGEAHPTLMVAPEERRLYLLRQADGRSLGVMRLRDNGRVGPTAPAGAARWTLRDGNLELCDEQGQTRSRFMLCGERAGLRLYLGESLADGAPQLLQEVRCTYARLSLLDPELVDPFCGLYDVDAMVPADLPAGSAVLLGAPHSGVDRLAEVLNRQGAVFFDGELLHPQAIGLAEGLLSPSADATLHAMRAKDGTWFARMMLGRSFDAMGRDLTAVPVRGFTLAPSHHPAALDWAIAEPALRIVHVVRSNLLAEFADILASQGSGAPTAARLHFEPERFGRFIEMKQRYLDGLRQRLVQRNGDTVEVDGSRLNANTVAELTGFLTDSTDLAGLAGDGASASGTRVIDRFDNPELVLPCLRALGRMGWLEIEGTQADPA